MWIAPATEAIEAGRLVELRSGLKENGLIESRDVTLQVLYANGEYQRFPELTQQALERKPAILIVVTIASVRAAQQMAGKVPVLFVRTNDPVGAGLVDSLARPGGNTTGVATMADDSTLKLLDMMHKVLPQAKHVRAVFNPGNATNRPIFERLKSAASPLGIELQPVELSDPAAVDGCFGPANAPRADALILMPDAMLGQVTPRIATLGIERRVPVLAPFSENAKMGTLLSYGPSLPAVLRRAGFYVKRILAGAAPRDLPVEQPTKFELIINLKTAKAIGVAIPQSVQAEADDLIE